MAVFGNAVQGYHMNGNLLCAIDTETTGLIPGYHDIIEIAIVPLNYMYEPDKKRPFFHTKIRPKRPHNFDPESTKVTKKTLDECTQHGIDPWVAVDRFEDWYTKLLLPKWKSIIPVGANYLGFDMHFIMDWLGGWKNYHHYFRNDVRDVTLCAWHQNDIAENASDVVPFREAKLSTLCNILEIDRLPAHDALSDALAAAEVYKRLVRRMHP